MAYNRAADGAGFFCRTGSWRSFLQLFEVWGRNWRLRGTGKKAGQSAKRQLVEVKILRRGRRFLLGHLAVEVAGRLSPLLLGTVQASG